VVAIEHGLEIAGCSGLYAAPESACSSCCWPVCLPGAPAESRQSRVRDQPESPGLRSSADGEVQERANNLYFCDRISRRLYLALSARKT
jgi:hypothetical protein